VRRWRRQQYQMRSWILGLASLCMLVGCRQLPPVRLLAKIDADATMSPVADHSPVVEMALPDGPVPPDAARIAVLDVDGLLLNSNLTGLYSQGDNPVALFRERLDAIAADRLVCAVILRINSPGGGVTATDIMWHDLMKFKMRTRLPVIACLLDLGTGGAYYLATAADHIVAHPTTITGGIGVILNYYNLQDAMSQFNIVGAPIKAGKNIDLGTPIRALDDEHRKLLQTMANEFHDRFRRVVEKCRPEVDQDDNANFDGRVFTAGQALNRNLIDRIGYLDDAIVMAQNIAHQRCATVVFFHRLSDEARSTYAVTPNVPLQGGLIPVSLPGFDRSKLPSFLYLWQPEPTMEKLSGR
jgi:protease IV